MLGGYSDHCAIPVLYFSPALYPIDLITCVHLIWIFNDRSALHVLHSSSLFSPSKDFDDYEEEA